VGVCSGNRLAANASASVLSELPGSEDSAKRLARHPYTDGNGRVGHFPMNTMMASGGHPWTVIPVTNRNAYVSTLEKASVGEDIAPFADSSPGW
jgi:hypothetical protein